MTATAWASTTRPPGANPVNAYVVRSSVLGGAAVTKLTATGAKDIIFVLSGGLVDTQQTLDYNQQPKVEWIHRDPLGANEVQYGVAAYDPLGHRVANNPPNVPPQQQAAPPMGMGGAGGVTGLGGSNAGNFSTGWRRGGVATDCDSVFRASHKGGVDITGWKDLCANFNPHYGLPNPPPGLFFDRSWRVAGCGRVGGGAAGPCHRCSDERRGQHRRKKTDVCWTSATYPAGIR